jgi:hypothetical protein
MRLEINGLGDKGREQATVALQALERAIAGIRFLEEKRDQYL